MKYQLVYTRIGDGERVVASEPMSHAECLRFEREFRWTITGRERETLGFQLVRRPKS